MDRILLTVPSGTRGDGIVSLVLGGLGSRLDLPVDRIDELALAATTVSGSALGESLELEVDVLAERIVLRLGPLAAGASAEPARRRVIDPLVDGATTIDRAGHEWCELEVRRGVMQRGVTG